MPPNEPTQLHASTQEDTRNDLSDGSQQEHTLGFFFQGEREFMGTTKATRGRKHNCLLYINVQPLSQFHLIVSGTKMVPICLPTYQVLRGSLFGEICPLSFRPPKMLPDPVTCSPTFLAQSSHMTRFSSKTSGQRLAFRPQKSKMTKM